MLPALSAADNEAVLEEILAWCAIDTRRVALQWQRYVREQRYSNTDARDEVRAGYIVTYYSLQI